MTAEERIAQIMQMHGVSEDVAQEMYFIEQGGDDVIVINDDDSENDVEADSAESPSSLSILTLTWLLNHRRDSSGNGNDFSDIAGLHVISHSGLGSR